MRQDWIEFEGKEGNKILLRPEYVSSLCNNWNNTGCVMVGYDEHMMINDEGRSSSFALVNEPYEQVKQKIMDAEKVDFTKEEYKHLLRLCENATQPNDGYTPDWTKLNPIMNKLNEILKEKE